MKTTNWHYTTGERILIDAAWDEITTMLDAIGNHGTDRLNAALRIERRGRGIARMAKSALINGFAFGMNENPNASTVAAFSEGVATAILLGADYGSRRRGSKVGHFDPTPADRDRMPATLAAAKAAHDSAWNRYIAACRA